jgi:hypothetical protein
MSTYKRIDGDYSIISINSSDNVIIDTNTVKIQGNLDVTGNLTYINVTELNVKDPFILLNSSNTGSYESNSGMLVHKTSSDYAGLRWNNTTGVWQVSSSTGNSGTTGTWSNIAIGNISNVPAPGSNTQVIFNNSGTLGANANLTFDFSTSKVLVQGHQAFGNIGTSPAITANAVSVYHNAQGVGGTGLYVKSATVQDELVSRAKAIVFALIL